MRKTLLVIAVAATPGVALAADFRFGSNAGGFNGQTSVVLNEAGSSLLLTAGPLGAVLDERSSGGLGVNSRILPGVTGGEVDKFDVIEGSAAVAGAGEFVTLQFDTPGVITAIDFDGVKDESFEYFILTTESGARINFFDSASNTTVPGAVDAAISDGAVTGEVVYMLEGGGFDDEAFGLTIPVLAGDLVTITYAELGPTYGPLLSPNGARFQGVTFEASIPEPSTCLLSILVIAASCAGDRSRR